MNEQSSAALMTALRSTMDRTLPTNNTTPSAFHQDDILPDQFVTNMMYGTLPVVEEEVPVMPDGLRMILGIFLFVVFIIGFTGNLTVIWVFSR